MRCRAAKHKIAVAAAAAFSELAAPVMGILTVRSHRSRQAAGQAGGFVAGQEQDGPGEVGVEDVDVAVLVGACQHDRGSPGRAER